MLLFPIEMSMVFLIGFYDKYNGIVEYVLNTCRYSMNGISSDFRSYYSESTSIKSFVFSEGEENDTAFDMS